MEFITDRTGTDVLMGRKKGYYNYDDLNRVEGAVSELSNRWGLQLPTKTNWQEGDLILKSDMTRYLQNLHAVRDHWMGLGKQNTYVQLPSSMDNLTWRDANNIEDLLQQAYSWGVSELGKFVLGRSTLGGI